MDARVEIQTIDIVTKTFVGIFTIGGILFAVWKGLEELRRQRKQREDELVVRKMELAQKLLDNFAGDQKAQDAAEMIDWTEKSF